MGISKRSMHDPDVCPECGAEMVENEDGDMECGSFDPCMSDIDKVEARRKHDDD